MADEEKVTITATAYRMLVRDSNELSRLYAAGVDNWKGYEYAFEDDGDED